MSLSYIIMAGVSGVVLLGVLLKFKRGSTRIGPLLTGFALVVLVLSLGRIFLTLGAGSSSLDRFIRYQEVQGEYVGWRVAKDYPGARVGIVQQHDLSGVIKEGAVMNRLARAIHGALTDAGMDVHIRSLPLSKAIQEMVDRAREEGKVLDEGDFLVALENDEGAPIDFFNAVLESLSAEVDVVVSLVDFGYGDWVMQLPQKGVAPPLVLVNTWVEHAEEVLEKSAVAAIVRPRRDLEPSAYDRSLRGGARKIFPRRFEYLTLDSSPESTDE